MRTLIITLTLCQAALPAAVAQLAIPARPGQVYPAPQPPYNTFHGYPVPAPPAPNIPMTAPRVQPFQVPQVAVPEVPHYVGPRYSGAGDPFGSKYPNAYTDGLGHYCTNVQTGMFLQRVCN
jgi:hypothetical protein